MRIIDLLRLAIGRLGTGKLRTALTMLGIIIGVASVVALVGVAQGATKGISNQLTPWAPTCSPSARASADSATRGAVRLGDHPHHRRRVRHHRASTACNGRA